MLTLRPIGRGNWRTVTMKIDGARAAPLLVRVGDKVPVGGIVFRVVRVQA